MNNADKPKVGHGQHAHIHTHGVVDPSILTTQRGIWAIKCSFIGLFATATFQIVMVIEKSSRNQCC